MFLCESSEEKMNVNVVALAIGMMLTLVVLLYVTKSDSVPVGKPSARQMCLNMHLIFQKTA